MPYVTGPRRASPYLGPAPGDTLFADEFDGPAGSLPGSQWGYDIGRGDNGDGFGNGETSYETAVNACLDGSGSLDVTLRREMPPDGDLSRPFTGSRLTSRPLRFVPPVRVETRVKLAAPTGVYHGFWLYGDVDLTVTDWPKCGEIDIFEAAQYVPPNEPNLEHQMIFGCFQDPIVPNTSNPYEIAQDQTYFDIGELYSANWHVVRLDWLADSVKWFLDGVQVKEITPAGFAASNRRWHYDGEFPQRLIFNMAAGAFGNHPPPEFESATCKIDYVRATRL